MTVVGLGVFLGVSLGVVKNLQEDNKIGNKDFAMNDPYQKLPVVTKTIKKDKEEDKKPQVPDAVEVTNAHRDATPDLPEHVPYLLVGGGTSSFAAYRAIRAADPSARVFIITEEERIPYMRPPLSKEMWFSDEITADANDVKFRQWNGRDRSLYFEPREFYSRRKSPAEGKPPADSRDPEKEDTNVGSEDLKDAEGPFVKKAESGINVITGRKVVKIDAARQEAELDNGRVITYGKCLLATGGKPKVLPVLARNSRLSSKVSTFRTIDDFLRLREMTGHVRSVAVIGGGFLGSELACALGNKATEGKNGLEVVQIFKEKGNMAKVLPDYLSQWTTEKVRKEGVTVKPNTTIRDAIITPESRLLLLTSDGEEIVVDHAVIAVGLEPNTDLAKSSGLELDDKLGGFRVNAELEARTNLYAAGDAACFYDVSLGRRRVEHHDHAVVSGRLAGENMAAMGDNKRKHYTHQSMFWSDIGPDVGYEAIGIVDSSLPTVAVFAKASEGDTPKAAVMESGEAMRSDAENKENSSSTQTASTSQAEEQDVEKYGKGVIFYLRDDVIVGIVLWNVFAKMSTARKIIRERKGSEEVSELAKLFDIQKEITS